MITDRNAIQPGIKLIASYKKDDYTAVVVGNIGPSVEIVDGPSSAAAIMNQPFKSLSKAAMAITGNSVNGWRWWSVVGQEPKAKTGPAPRPATERFWAKVNKDGPIPDFKPELGPCWIWDGAKDSKGYGNFVEERNRTEGVARYVKAHTFAFVEENGPLPAGLEPDHLCRVHACVRPSHMEAVTRKVNLNRGAGIGGVLSDGNNPNLAAANAARLSKPRQATTPPQGLAGGPLDPESGDERDTSIDRKPRKRVKAYNPIRRTANQLGLEADSVRFWCDGCMASFTIADVPFDSKDPDTRCAEGHRVGDMREAGAPTPLATVENLSNS